MKFKSEVQLEALNNATVDTDKFLVSDSSTVKYRTGAEVLSDIGAQAALTNPVTGTGTLNFVSKFTSTGSTLGDSQIFDNGTNVGIGTNIPAGKLNAIGDIIAGSYTYTTGVNLQNRTAKSLLYISTDGVNNAIGSTITYTWTDGGQGPLKFNNTSGEVMRLDASGKLGVGTTNPTSRIHSVTSASGPVSYENRCAIFGYNTSTDTVYNNPVGIAGRVLTSGGRAIYGDATTGGGWGGYFDGKGYFSANVGIGTTSPSSRLHVYSSSEVSRIESANTTLYQTFRANGTNVGYIGNGTGVVGGGSATDFGIQAPNNFVFATGGSSERMRITSAGNVGIGTASPTRRLDVVGDHNTSTFRVYYPELNVAGQDASVDIWASEPGVSFNGSGIGSNVNGQPYYGRTNPALGQGFIRFIDGTTAFHNSSGNAVYTERMRITPGGNVGIGTSSPSTLLDVNGIISATGGNSTDWNAKQENLVSGTNIKTLNGNSVLGSGDLSTKGIHTLVTPAVGETTSFLLYGQTIGTVVGTPNRLTAVPYIPATTITCSSLYINVTTALAGSNARILIYSDDNGKPGTKIYESANLDCSTTGIKTATTTQTFEAGTIYWICSQSSSTQSFSSAFQNALIPINFSGISVFTSYYITPTFGSAPSTFGTGTYIQSTIPFIGIKI